ncbi:hypothetical protein H845_3575 (plasmid) [Komagataeibacter xylinus E25]|nr:hypothetical protein H845_3575 [Komagataeibacter xylinus E25]
MAQPSRTARSHPLRGRLDCGADPLYIFFLFIDYNYFILYFYTYISEHHLKQYFYILYL